MYILELGPYEQNIAKQAAQAGDPLPDRIANAPELQLGLQLYLNAFFDLDTERNHAGSLTPIPRSKMVRYADDNELDAEQTADLLHLVRKMDNAHLDRLDRKTSKNGG